MSINAAVPFGRGCHAARHQAVQDALARGQPSLDAGLLAGLRQRYDEAATFGISRNRHRDWAGDGNHPGYALSTWLAGYAGQVWLFTEQFEVEWTSNSAARRQRRDRAHQAVSGYWHTQATLGR
jgi:transposase